MQVRILQGPLIEFDMASKKFEKVHCLSLLKHNACGTIILGWKLTQVAEGTSLENW